MLQFNKGKHFGIYNSEILQRQALYPLEPKLVFIFKNMGIMTIILPDTVNNLVSKRITDLMRNNLKRKPCHKYCKLQFLAGDVMSNSSGLTIYYHAVNTSIKP